MGLTDDLEVLKKEFEEGVQDLSIEGLGAVLVVDSDSLPGVAKAVKDMGFDYLSFVTAVDYMDKITLVYRLQSLASKSGGNLTIKVHLDRDEPVVDSVVTFWAGADWHEREIYDLFGVDFKGHPDLRRMFLPDDWEGHPLRKDYEDEDMVKRPDHY